MCINLGKHTDGVSPLPVSVINNNKEITKYYKDPFLSMLSNLMIQTITGNASLKHAKVICLSDLHYDGLQKYVRAQIINEINHFRNKTCNAVIFLVEGTHYGHEPEEFVYEQLIGKNLINFDHIVFGWDDIKLNRSGIKLIRKMQVLRLNFKELEKNYSFLNKKKFEILTNSKILPEKQFEILDSLEEEMNYLLAQGEKTSISIDEILNRIHAYADKRTDYLHQSIQKTIHAYPEALIFAIGGGDHFKRISKELHHIQHCIITLQETKKMQNFDASFKKVYGDV